ncbi:MAG TPA: PLP-dependent aminotransferase family protein [Blastocatellia bacterium]|nr:PLP-dependent aminotransferase family protein [Blastocatellia bacterium]
MSKQSAAMPFTTLSLDTSSPVPLYRQLYEGLRHAILSGQLRPSARLQSTRELAAELGVSRNTVMNAFEQLLAEGYLEGQVGSGTYVSRALPDDMLQAGAVSVRAGRARRKGRALSDRGLVIANTMVNASPAPSSTRAFRPGTPALDRFPFDVWMKLTARHWRYPRRDLLGYGDSAGYGPLREAISEYLGAARAVLCDPEQVIITSGAQQALDLAARLLLDAGDSVWIEDPGFLGARSSLVGAGARLVPVPVDEEGLDVARGATLCPSARLVYISPSHHFPLGVTMSLARRLSLLEWASRAGAWILEDDYDSEYRYAGRPLAALQGLDKEGRVIYLGTFSKILFPSLRLGYMVVPFDLVDAFKNARAILSRFSPSIEQAVLTDFMMEGHFARHIRRMRELYRERQECLIEAARRELGGALELEPDEAGMHLVGRLPSGADDRAVSRKANKLGVEASPLSLYFIERARTSGLILGYAGYDEREIRKGVRLLAAALDI